MIDIQAHHQLERYREDLASGFYDTIIEQSLKLLAENDTERPADVALYALGEVYAHYEYAGRDYGLSQFYFEQLIQKFPYSPLVHEAKTYISLFENIDAKEQAIALQQAKLRSKQKVIDSARNKAPKRIVEKNDFAEAVRKNKEILAKTGQKRPADSALYNLGLIYAHLDNPSKDFKKSQQYFTQLRQQFPDSEYAEEAHIWLGIFQTIEKIQQIDVDIEQQKKQLIQ